MVLDRTLDIRDGAVRFRVLSGGRGPHLVYFHSFHERGGWSPFLDHLAARYTVLAPFHPGVQGSSGVETLDDVLDLVLAYDELLDGLGIGAAHLVGHFFGGMVAAELAATLRPRAAKLVLISPLGLWRDDAPSQDLLILPHEDLPAVLFRDPASEVGPGAIATDLRANSTRILGTDAPEMRGIGGDEAAVRAITPAARRGTLEEVAAAACYLAGEEAAYVTGQTLVIDGGWTAR